MASSSPIKNKSGVVYAYQIKVYRGRDADGKQLKQYSTVWKIPDGMKNSRTIKKELDRFAVLFEQQCKEGLVSTDKKTFAAYAEYFMTLKERDQKHHANIHGKRRKRECQGLCSCRRPEMKAGVPC